MKNNIPLDFDVVYFILCIYNAMKYNYTLIN